MSADSTGSAAGRPTYHDQEDVIGFCADYRHPWGCQGDDEDESPTAYPHRPTLYPHEQVGGGSGVMDSDAIFEAARDESGLMLTEPAREVLRVVFGAIDATDEMWQPMVGPTTREYAHTIVAHLDQLLGNTSSP